MKKFKIQITETLTRMEEVKAETLQSAMEMVKQKYEKEEILLVSEDFKGVEFDLSNLESFEKDETFKLFLMQMAQTEVNHLSLEDLAKISFEDNYSAVYEYYAHQNSNS